ncbi:Zinc carboxypeptidase domain protein [Minicystis rosea]|nr:Zinc carboxypeptidase domain protein [Minicystis rosea]
MWIDCDFDGGSIRILEAEEPGRAVLGLRADNAADFRQWFYFRARGVADMPCTFTIADAGSSTFPGGWNDYHACASYDGEEWFRVPTERDGDALIIRHAPRRDVVAYACFAPYSSDRCAALIERARASDLATVVTLGESIEGRPMNVVVIGDQQSSLPRLWIIAQQHPGETSAGWCAEGIVDRLLDEDDETAAALRDRAVVYVVPRMNPDGAARGNHRTNAAGLDLNRAWSEPSMETSPEVFLVRAAMDASGVDFFLDIHGEEEIPYLFDFGAEGVPNYGERLAALEEMFRDALEAAEESYQREEGYDRDPPGGADLGLANAYVADRFDCLSMGLELPFKDDESHPEPEVGWSPDRSRHLGRAVVEAVLACVGSLR